MTTRDAAPSALAAVQQLRRSRGFAALPNGERAALERDLRRLESSLGSPAVAEAQAADPYAAGMAGEFPFPGKSPAPAPAPAPPPPPAQPGTATIGRRAGDALEAVNFPGFVASLLQGTFQAIVDATVQQVREYAALVASLSQSIDAFARDNVSASQIRGELAQRYPQDLAIAMPEPGKPGEARLVPRPGRGDEPPGWLAEFDLDGETFDDRLTEGPLLQAGRAHVAEQRMQMLATTVLMGINRIVINDGDIRARLAFHASASEKTNADVLTANVGQGGGIASRSLGGGSGGGGASMMVSTLKANAQADASIKADLMGSVRISFRTETFPLERFADSGAIQLIQRHAKWGATSDDKKPAEPPKQPRKAEEDV
jgi:hypothetical protein